MASTQRLNPEDELSPASLKKVNALTEATHSAMDSMEYNLQTDKIKVPGQNWVCVSFVTPNGNQKTKDGSLGMKIRGVFDTHQEAVDHVKRLIRMDPTFDIYICSMYEWCLVPPDNDKIRDQVYQNEELNKILSEYNKNQIYAKEHFEERKRELVEQATEEARKGALKRLEEEEARKLIDVTENDELGQVDPETGEHIESVSASDIMDSMVNCQI